jgi:hypothetical protein
MAHGAEISESIAFMLKLYYAKPRRAHFDSTHFDKLSTSSATHASNFKTLQILLHAPCSMPNAKMQYR